MILSLNCTKNNKRYPLSLVRCDDCKKERLVSTGNLQRKENKNSNHFCKSCANKGTKNPHFGKKISEENSKRMSERNSGKGNPMYGVKRPEMIEKLRQINTGKTLTEEHKKKMSISLKGKTSGIKHYKWNPNLKDEDRIAKRDITEFRIWSKNVKKRDNYKCQICQENTNDLNSHHLNGWDIFPEERYILDNGTCLCSYCHKLFHSIYGLGNNTKSQFLQFRSTILNGY